MKQVGVVLSGCGVFDGAEIHESVITLLALDRAGVRACLFAPDKPQLHVINHLSGAVISENRNILTEAARIARGDIKPLSQASAAELDALIVPGGFGAAKNLSTFATQGAACSVDPELKALVQQFYQAGKPLGFICIAPALLPRLLEQRVRVTIGNDPNIAEAIEAMGGEHVVCPVNDIVIDLNHNVVTTPAYMLAHSIGEAAQGIEKLVAQVLELAA